MIEKCGLSIGHLGQTEFRKKVTEVVGIIGTLCAIHTLNISQL